MLRQSLDCPIKSGNDIYGGNRAILSFAPRIKVVDVVLDIVAYICYDIYREY